ncbi:DeoR/GlpR family DNA-binding transcription regulator [Massilia sp. P8910]|uniref:DeoR/GlpR family DNA-binding transcription regulator n=1 Tax=Massilia antarctica TaxID=2765360 RepID=UPI001E29FF96|nr:DeoR/GlpR family DNA-binding transcription regulator [Massilia antarctica]MCE3602950.1 DeoR/GlpR family DNA-binding transcription regulator [Massilia antarctica]
MLTTQRKQYLMDLLRRDGQVVAKAVSEALGLSEDTIRRDLRELAREGMLQRVHGGALPALPASPALADFDARVRISPDTKAAIGRAGAALVEPGQVVLIDGGTTTGHLVRHLPLALRATVLTHSPSVALALLGHEQVEVIMLGGRLYRHSVVGVGAATLEAIAQVRADLCFLGVSSIDPDAGLSTGDFEEAAVKRAMWRAAAHTVVLASPEKLATTSPYRIAGADQIGALVVARGTDEALLARYRALGVTVHVAGA